jgi:hypothetical protein
MLPFLAPKKIVSTISARRGKSPDIEVNTEAEAPGSHMAPGLKTAAEDLMRALETKSPMDIGRALQMAFEACDSEPHKEGPHINEGE